MATDKPISEYEPSPEDQELLSRLGIEQHTAVKTGVYAPINQLPDPELLRFLHDRRFSDRLSRIVDIAASYERAGQRLTVACAGLLLTDCILAPDRSFVTYDQLASISREAASLLQYPDHSTRTVSAQYLHDLRDRLIPDRQRRSTTGAYLEY